MIGRGRDLSQRQDTLVFKVKAFEAQRLDVYVWTALSWKSRNRIQSLIRAGKVKVNGETAKPSRKVRGGDSIAVELPNPDATTPDYDSLEIDVLYEDPWIIAVNKPPGLLVHPVGRHIYDTLLNYLHHRYRDRLDEDGDPVRPRLCHRLDMDTTGVVVIGLDAYVHNEVRYQFENRLVSKEYIALVKGRYPSPGAIEIPIGEGHDLPSSLQHEVLKEARTEVRVIERWGSHTLLSCIPRTGRQNQIRIHLSAVGFPIVGDERFGGGSPPPGFPRRYLLHSRAIRFLHPRWKCPVELTAELPIDFLQLAGSLRASPQHLPVDEDLASRLDG